MGWWSRFQDWLDKPLIDPALKESALDDWEPGPHIWLPNDPPTPAECSAAQAGASSQDSAPAAIPSISDPTRSDDVSDGKNDSGDVTTETTLEHAEYLPGATFRVFPSSGNHRNSYDSEDSVRRAVAARKAKPTWKTGKFVPEPIKVYRARTGWEDVSDDFVKPWTSLP